MDTLTTALRLLARDIDSPDGVATTVILQAADEIERLRLTDAERALLEMLADHPVTHEIMPNEVATLRGLMERTK